MDAQTMSADTTETRICAIIRRVSKQKGLDGELPTDADVFRDLGVESTAALDLLFSMEDEFGISIPDDSFSGARTVRKMTELIDSLRGGQ
jgi:acyl carrier protein